GQSPEPRNWREIRRRWQGAALGQNALRLLGRGVCAAGRVAQTGRRHAGDDDFIETGIKERFVMKKSGCLLVAAALLFTALPAIAAKGKTDLHDKAALVELSALQARRSMLTLCGVTGDALETMLAKDREKEARLVFSLSDAGKKALPDAL